MVRAVSARPKVVMSRVEVEDGYRLHVARSLGAYRALERALTMPPPEVIDEVATSGLTGRSGGAGFPTATKWRLLRDAYPRYVVCNGDESEPGTAKDRVLMERDPHQLIEGALICAYAIGAERVVIYVRGELALAQERLVAAANEAYEAGLCGRSILGTQVGIDVVIHWGAGAYIVGEETAMLESIEGERGMPRPKPPYFPAAIGLYQQPTIVNNVETLSSLPWIILRGGGAFAAFGDGRSKGMRVFSVSGHVKRPGNYEVELHATTFRELLLGDEYAGGILDDRPLKAFVAGASFPWFFPEQLDLPLDIDVVAANGSSLGSGIMVMNNSVCAVQMAHNLTRFFASESCGKCVPCREGGAWAERIMGRIADGAGRIEDLAMLDEICELVSPGPFPRAGWELRGEAPIPFPYRQTTICGLGPSTMSALKSTLHRFRNEYIAHVEQACPRCHFGHVRD
jgi:NADH-quinone oxidoreductase subunit F